MTNRFRLLAACGFACAALAAAPARAGDDDCHGPIGRWQAIAIAHTVGLVRVEEVDCDDGKWEVEGLDAFGREMEVEVSARTGRILEVEYDD
jgi:uncharacterized membrane protein YkoI